MTRSTVFYNGACPVCRREIDHYRSLDHRHAKALDFCDINGAERQLASLGLSKDDARRRLYVHEPDNGLMSGIHAFAAIWDRLPPYRWLGTLSRLPVLKTVLPWVYEAIAFGLYRWDKRRRA